MRDHRRLEVYHFAHRLVLLVYRATREFPREERYGLTSQVRRSAASISTNIVEGCARHSEADYLRFLDIAYGSAKELEYQVLLGHDLGYLPPDGQARLMQECGRVARMLNALMAAIRRNRKT
ncbi:MAG: four helix bundle protein [Planctomycetota bacterium]|jgi:four helix bundle protein